MIKKILFICFTVLFSVSMTLAITEEEIYTELHKQGDNAKISLYDNGILILNKNNKYGILKYQGVEDNSALYSTNYEYDSIEKVLLKTTPDNVQHYFYKTKKKNKYGAFDSYGNFITSPIYDDIQISCEKEAKSYNSEIFIVKLGNNFGGYTHQQTLYNLSVPVQYDNIELLSENSWDYYILVTKNGKKGLYISTGRTTNPTILPTVFDEISIPQIPYVVVKQYGKYGAFFWEEQVVPIKYDNIKPIGHDIIVTLNSKQGVYHEGNIIVPVEYDEVKRAENSIISFYDDGAKFIVKKNNKYGIYNMSPIEFDDIQEVYRGFVTEKNGKYGLYHLTRGKLLNPEFDKIYMKDNTTLICEKNGKTEKIINMDIKSADEKASEALFHTMFFWLELPLKGLH